MALATSGTDVFAVGPTSSSLTTDRTCTSIHGELICPPLRSGRTQEVFQTIFKGRKSWKTLRGNGEPVWPPELEAALLEGLESYQPDDSRETRLLGRFPMRNRFISDYIYNVTGKRRTAKQVGSRLQQLRDTCGGKRLLSLLSPTRRAGPAYRSSSFPAGSGMPSLSCDVSSSSDTSSVGSPITPMEGDPSTSYFDEPPPAPRALIYIDILPEDNASPPPSPASSSFSASTFSTSSPPPTPPKCDPAYVVDALSSPSAAMASTDVSCAFSNDNIFRPSPYPRHLKTIDPTITFLSQSTILADSFFTVFSDDVAVYSESAPLVQLTPPSSGTSSEADNTLLYSTSLVPGYWKIISESVDPTRYTIVQEVTQSSDSMSTSVLFSAVYKFNYSSESSTPQLSSSPILENAPADMSTGEPDPPLDFSLDCLLPMDPDAFTSSFGSDKHEPFYEYINNFEVGGGWGVSPQQILQGDSSSSLPSSTSFPMDLSSFVM